LRRAEAAGRRHGIESAAEQLYSAIAHRLSSSPRTIETHVSRILRKLDLTSRLQVGLFLSNESATDRETALG
jgi:hypothetical protein